MATFKLIEYQDASPEVRAIYDDIMATRKIDWINNFWKGIAHDPATLKRTWESIKQIMAPGALDALTKELLYIAVSVTNNCSYCIASHTASARDNLSASSPLRTASSNVLPSYTEPAIACPCRTRAIALHGTADGGHGARRGAASRCGWE